MKNTFPALARWVVAASLCGAVLPAAAAHTKGPWVDEAAVQGGVIPKIDEARLGAAVRRCGWWDNPSPGNVWLTDRQGQWTVAMQGVYEAAGDGPAFAPSQLAPRDAPHGHGCACMMVRADLASRLVYDFYEAKALPLKSCRRPLCRGRESIEAC